MNPRTAERSDIGNDDNTIAHNATEQTLPYGECRGLAGLQRLDTASFNAAFSAS